MLATIWGGNQYEWASPQIIGLLIFSVVAALVFIPVENRAAEADYAHVPVQEP